MNGLKDKLRFCLLGKRTGTIQQKASLKAEAASVAALADLLPVLTVAQLLTPYREWLAQLDELAGVPEPVFKNLYLAAIQQFARFVQQLPASEVHHHAGMGGLLMHSLEVCVLALRQRRSYLFSAQDGAEEIAKKADLWTYAVFLGALCHDLGKPAIDQRIEVYRQQGHEPVLWMPFAAFMDEQGRYYRTSFVRERSYALHEKVTPLLIYRIVPKSGLNWLHSDPTIFAQWLAAISGDHAQSEAIGVIISQADGQSVAQNLGASSPRFSSVKTIPLHEKMLTSLRHLLSNGELPLNRNGAAGWVKATDCWLVSKRVIDAIRAQLTQEGHHGVPTQNSRMFDVLQEHGVLMPCGDKAIWRATISGDGWQNELTVLRIPVAILWPNLESRPEDFKGEIQTEDALAEVVLDELAAGEQPAPDIDSPAWVRFSPEPAGSDNTLNEVEQGEAEQDGMAISTHLPSSGKDTEAQQHDRKLVTGTENKPVTLEKQTTPSADVSTSGTVNANSKPTEKVDPFIPVVSGDVAHDFITWLQAGIQQHTIAVNHAGAKVHVVAEGVLLMTPIIFKAFAQTRDQDWMVLQRQILKKNWHSKAANGLNVVKYQVAGKQKKSVVNGILFTDARVIFGNAPIPQPNPHLTPV